MTMAGIVLSQPDSVTRPSSRWPRATSSTESAIQSRLMSEAFIPSVPMAMPSVTEIVLNSIGVPPLARTPSATFWASLRWFELHGRQLDPAVGDADQRAREVLVGEADRPEVRAGGGPVGTVQQGPALVAGIERHGDASLRSALRGAPRLRRSRSEPPMGGMGGHIRAPAERAVEHRPGCAGAVVSDWGFGGHVGAPIYRLIALCTQLLITSMRWLCQGSGSRPLVRYAKDTPESGSAQQYDEPTPPWPNVRGEASEPSPRMVAVVPARVRAEAPVHRHAHVGVDHVAGVSCASRTAPCAATAGARR